MTNDPTPERRMLTALFRLQLAQRHVTGLLTQSSGLSESDLVALGLLVRRPPVPVKELAVELGLNPGSTSTLVDRLVKAGMVGRSPSPQDGRVQLVAITADGEAVMAGARDRYAAALAGLGDDALVGDAATVVAALADRLLDDHDAPGVQRSRAR